MNTTPDTTILHTEISPTILKDAYQRLASKVDAVGYDIKAKGAQEDLNREQEPGAREVFREDLENLRKEKLDLTKNMIVMEAMDTLLAIAMLLQGKRKILADFSVHEYAPDMSEGALRELQDAIAESVARALVPYARNPSTETILHNANENVRVRDRILQIFNGPGTTPPSPSTPPQNS